MSGLNDMGFGQSNLPGVGSTSFGQPPSVPGMASRGFGRPANLPKVKVGPILGELAAASRATLGSVKSAGTVLGGRPGGRLGETPTSQPSG